MKSALILQSNVSHPIHERAARDLIGIYISSVSKWEDDIWKLDTDRHGGGDYISINWRIPSHDGSILTSPQHAQMLDWIRRVVWSLFAAPGDNCAPLSPTTIGQTISGLRIVVPWLIDNHVRWPREMTQKVLDEFLADLPGLICRRGDVSNPAEEQSSNDDLSDVEEDDAEDDDGLSHSAARRAIAVFYYIWRQRKALQRAQIDPMPSAPWPDENGPLALAAKIAPMVEGWVRPLADEIAIPLLNKAMWFLGVPGRDVVRLAHDLEVARTTAPPKQREYSESGQKKARLRRQRLAIANFSFLTIWGESHPWHVKLGKYSSADGEGDGPYRARRLVTSVQAACMVVLQAFTGMRVSELCALRAGVNPASGLPIDVTVKVSPTGLNEEFVLWSELTKGQIHPRKFPWLLGARRLGDTELPPGVQAMVLLDQLLAPFRSMIQSDRLLVSLKSRRSLPKSSDGVAKITRAKILKLYKDFIAEWVDLSSLPDQSQSAVEPNDLVIWRESGGNVITTYQLRKTYANYVLSVHPNLLPAVKRQFHHASMAITENAYWGSSSPQIEPIRSVSSQMTAQLLFDAIHGRSTLTGRMGDQILEYLDGLRQLVQGLSMPTAWIRLNQWVDTNALHVNHAPHGACIPIQTRRMECWKRTQQRPLGALVPNYATREASLCVGCSCFAMNERHKPFWVERYVDNATNVRRLISQGCREQDVQEMQRRADQAKKKLFALGEDLHKLDNEVAKRLETYEIT